MYASALTVFSCVAMILPSIPDGASDSTAIIEPLPILSYDTDTGFGYGCKAIFRNQLDRRESFDLTLFGSSKGERWYRLGVSFPDAELRRGRPYGAAWDFVIDYDKWIRNSFFGVGNGSDFGARRFYTKEPLEFSLAFSHGFTSTLEGGLFFRYKSVRCLQAPDGSPIQSILPAAAATTVKYFSGGPVFRYDTRPGVINPDQGLLVECVGEYAHPLFPDGSPFLRIGGTVQQYNQLFLDDVILAWRFSFQGLSGRNIPFQMILPVGGNNTLRGSPQDRYLDKLAGVFNAELRALLVWRIGAVAGFDAGRVWSALKFLTLRDWAMNPVAGLRLYMQTFVVRLDVGIGRETTGVFLNFGHIF